MIFILMILADLVFGLVLGLRFVLVDTRPQLIISRSPTEASARSLITALIFGSITALALALASMVLTLAPIWEKPLTWLFCGLGIELGLGLVIGGFRVMTNGGWFVLLQRVAYRHLIRAGNLPSHP